MQTTTQELNAKIEKLEKINTDLSRWKTLTAIWAIACLSLWGSILSISFTDYRVSLFFSMASLGITILSLLVSILMVSSLVLVFFGKRFVAKIEKEQQNEQ